MADELSYIIITPYTIVKSRTGGVISRLLSRLDLELVAAQIIAPSAELAERYAESMYHNHYINRASSAEILHDYILGSLSPSEGRRHRVLMLLFKGENACRKLTDIAGALYPEHRSMESITGETIRDTYADLIMDPVDKEKVRYFDPAVLTAPTHVDAMRNMKMWADFAAGESNIVENMKYPNPTEIERTLVIIKPDNWRFPSSRPGTIIDMFSRTGLRIISCKLYQMSVADALDFYGPVREVLKGKLAPVIAKKARVLLEDTFKLHLDYDTETSLAGSFGVQYAEDQFSQIIEFMSGTRPEKCTAEELERPGKVKSMCLVYEGEQAIRKIRDVLGPTDPTKAPGGTVRREFGSDVMVNTAHASDTPESARREMQIVKVRENNLARIVFDYLEKQGF